MKILLADYDSEELEITAYALRRHGFTVSVALDGKSTIAKWYSENPDLIILETALPKTNGIDVCRQIREKSEVPVMFLSEKFGDQDVVAAFNAGGDDYVVKPFRTRQLVARVRALLRRYATYQERLQKVDNAINVGNLVIDSEKRRITIGEAQVHMTPLEFRLLFYLANNKGRIINTDQLINYAWGNRDGGDRGTLRTHISRIRQKLDSVHPNGGYIKSIPGIGYSLED